MFPLEYPFKALQKHRRAGPIVIDPFCGRGTTLYAARKLQLPSWGVDSSPVAIAIAQAKLATCDTEDPLRLAEEAIATIDPQEIPDSRFFGAAFHPTTLREICAVREYLMQLDAETDASVVLRAAMLGCLHGPLPKKLENAGYFSNQMPRTYASKPDYAVRYWVAKGLEAKRIDILTVLRRKIARLSGLPDGAYSSPANVVQGDAQVATNFRLTRGSDRVIVTSPPYYGMRTYVQDQWLRNWFLGGPDSVDYSAGPQLSHGSEESFAKSLGKVWKNVCRNAPQSVHMYVRIGVIPSALVDVRSLFQQSLEESRINWRVVSIRSAKTAESGKRQATQMKTESPAAIEFDFHVEKI